jgi:catechol 2,3-dioxygenase-like lactoylglutathione lyase family enzyme
MPADRNSGPPAARAFCHVGITVPDLDRAVEWYRDVLGFDLLSGPLELTADGSLAGDGAAAVFGARFRALRMAHMSTANGIGIELFEFGEPATERRPDPFEYWKTGISHICVVARDIDEMAARIAETGGKVRVPPYEMAPGLPYRWCYCEDPFGTVLELYTHSHEQVYSNRNGP